MKLFDGFDRIVIVHSKQMSVGNISNYDITFTVEALEAKTRLGYVGSGRRQ